MKHLLYLFLFLSVSLRATDFPAVPRNYVTDEANVIPDEEERLLNAKLKAYEDSTSNQIYVYLAPSLNGNVMTDLCQQIFHTWKIGKEGKNNGVLIAVFVDDHKFRIHTGYGMEGSLPDVLTKRIQDDYMRSYFKEGNYAEGIKAGIGQLIEHIGKEYKQEYGEVKTVPMREEVDYSGLVLMYSIQAAMYFFLYLIVKNRFKDSKAATLGFLITGAVFLLIPGLGIFFLFAMLILAALSGRKGGKGTAYDTSYDVDSSSSSSWSAYSSDSSDSSDFDGGGGGDSGGGGSDSSW